MQGCSLLTRREIATTSQECWLRDDNLKLSSVIVKTRGYLARFQPSHTFSPFHPLTKEIASL